MPFPEIDPVAFTIPFVGLPIRWYALAYITGIVLGWAYLSRLIKQSDRWGRLGAPINKTQLDDVIFWVALGVILGGRLGYVFFYEPSLLIKAWPSLGADMNDGFMKTVIGWVHLPPAIMLWKGGMSFHGGLIGVTVAGYFFAKRNKLNALSLGDLFACAAPIGLFFGRIANFINAELYGRPWNGPWAMQFPYTNAQGIRELTEPRHPSQIYEAALEGVVLFGIIWFVTHKLDLLKRPGATIGVFLAGYGVARTFVEFFREPDWHMPDFPLGLTMGMMLSIPMVVLGVWLINRTRTVKPKKRNAAA